MSSVRVRLGTLPRDLASFCKVFSFFTVFSCKYSIFTIFTLLKEVRLKFVIYIDDHIEDMDLNQALTQVSAQRREKALRFHHEAGRRQSVAAYRLLQMALEEEYGITEPQDLAFGEHGKPYLKEHPDIHFSLSHCKVAVACAVSDHPVGIDIEHIRPFNKELAAYVLNEDQLEQVLQSTDSAVEFLKFWTQKESFLKLTGEGIRNDLKKLDLSSVKLQTTMNLDRQYIWTVASYE